MNSNSNKRNILILGGSGFIGSRLIERLLEGGYIVKNYDKNQSKAYPNLTFIGDVCDKDTLKKQAKGSDVIYNLAAEHRDDVTPKSFYDEVNVDGARNVCEVAEEKGINKIIFTSSVAIYGFAPVGTDETGEINPD